ncbi:MAG: response regulator [Planctomycetota bacterium]
MKKKQKPESTLKSHLRFVKKQLSGKHLGESQLNRVADELGQLGELARQDSNESLQRGAELLARVSELAASLKNDKDVDEQLLESMIDFLGENVPILDEVIEGADHQNEVDAFIADANANWQDYLSLFDGDDFSNENDAWSDDSATMHDVAEESNEDELDSDQVKLMLAALSGVSNDENQEAGDETANDEAVDKPVPAANPTQELESAAQALVGTPPKKKPFVPPAATNGDDDEVARQELANDRELLEAYLDDAMRCLNSMEHAAMQIEESPTDHETARQFCRELHTLKGASGTVGLRGLASDLHELESSLETNFALDSETIDADPLFAAVDRVRKVIDSLQSPTQAANDSPTSSEALSEVPKTRPAQDFGSFSANDDASIRIRASKLDRLMDMLAELVVLRNRRESHVTEFNDLNSELVRCATRVSFADEQSELDAYFDGDDPSVRRSASNLSEVAKDINEVSSGLRELQKPVIQDNLSISRFIRDFRQELMQLRRVPVSGLFSRLQRASRDAAKSEAKQVRVILEGEHAGLEQEIQERLFDSLLHVVRNSVSHGIESPSVRRKSDKDECGTITLSASSNAQLLMIEVRDDGGGINYDAVRQRGIEKGLLSADQRLSNEQLARLIFHPGFSTREKASEVSGRGVGMDVVATTIEQLHGRIEIDSTPGKGTTMRLLVPLRTGIEHVMVFQSGGQLFALPMQAVSAAKSAKVASKENLETVSLATALSVANTGETASGEVLILRDSSRGSGESDRQQLAIAIDQLIGPEEVVVRSLPNLLRNHPLMNGVTLSGSGKKVLLLDADRLVDFCVDHKDDLGVSKTEEPTQENQNQPRVLVIDDSLTARKVLGKFLRQHGLVVVEAGDGIEAIEKLHRETFDLVMTDLDMPRMGGLELLSDIEGGSYCDAPRVIVSSRNEEKFRDQATEAGACEFLTKPVNQNTVSQLLDQLQLLPTV